MSGINIVRSLPLFLQVGGGLAVVVLVGSFLWAAHDTWKWKRALREGRRGLKP